MNPRDTPITLHVRHARWYVRLWRWITRSPAPDGSQDRPYTKANHAFRAIPMILKPGQRYIVDITSTRQSEK